jgi:uncharacterized phage infection (PIP) family protein YhgE
MMASNKWENLLPASGATSLSRADMMEQLAQIATAASGGSNVAAGASGVPGGTAQGSAGDFTQQVSSLATQMTSLGSIQQTQVAAIQDNTQALAQNSTSKSSSGSSVGSTVGNIASSLLGGGSILTPILSGLMDLFGIGYGGQPAMAATTFQLPAPVQYEGGITGNSPGQVTPVSYGAAGQPRPQAASSVQQVNIQVSAIDSQSFLDHSNEIASAVRNALLNSHPLADVITGL